MIQEVQPIGGRLGVKATFECRDKDGNIIKLIHVEGDMPLQSAADAAAAQQLIQESQDGTDNRE